MGSEPAKRLYELDSVRGVAALTVVLRHLSGVWLEDGMHGSSHLSREVVAGTLYPFSRGHSAVMLFFVLSGFVLSIPAIHGRAQTYPVFAVRRVFRIYLPYLVALVFAVAGDMWLHGQITRSPGLNIAWSGPVDWRLVIQHVIFIGQYDSAQLNPPIWSLIYEMRISLFFPLVCALALRLKPAQSLALAFCLSFLSIAGAILLGTIHIHLPIGGTVHYTALFIVGIYLARQQSEIAEAYRRLAKWQRITLGVLSLVLYVYGSSVWLHVSQRFTSYNVLNSADWPTAVGAMGLIVLSLNSERCRRVLLWAPIHALGRMSYSVYLLHFIVLLLLVHLLYGRVPLLVILALCLVITIAASRVFYLFVEVPCMNMGRRLSGYV